jgi:hypothetical protein
MISRRPSIPEAVKLQLRQEADFGCCACGNPIIEYHHIVPWSKEQHNRPEDMMILCPNHHTTCGKFPEEVQRNIKNKPFNQNNPQLMGKLEHHNKDTRIIIGSNQFINCQSIISYEGKSVFQLSISESSKIHISLILFSKKGEVICYIKDNEWITQTRGVFDIKYMAPYRLRIKNALRDIAVNIDLSQSPIIIEGKMWLNGEQLIFNKNRIIFPNRSCVEGLTFVGASHAFMIKGKSLYMGYK